MAGVGRDAQRETIGTIDPKLVSQPGGSAQDSNPDVDPKTVTHPAFNPMGKAQSVDPKLVSSPKG